MIHSAGGKSFQVVGPTTANDFSRKVFHLVYGTSRTIPICVEEPTSIRISSNMIRCCYLVETLECVHCQFGGNMPFYGYPL